MPPASGTVCATVGSADHAAALGALGLRPGLLLSLEEPTAAPAPGADVPAAATVVVSAATLADLRRVLPALDRLGSATRVVVLVLDQGGDRLAVPGQVDPRVAVVGASAAPLAGSAGWRVEVRHAGPVPAAPVVRAAVRGTGARPWRSALGLRVGLLAPVPGDWVPADPLARTVEAAAGPVDRPNVDVLLVPVDGAAPPGAPAVTVPAAPTWRELATATSGRLRSAVLTDERAVPPVDDGVLNPIGFRAAGCAGTGELAGACDGSGWVVRQEGRELRRLPADGRVTDADVRSLRGLDAVDVRWDRSAGPASAVRVVVQLAAAGVPLLSGPVPSWAVRLLGPAVVAALTATRWAAQDELGREEHSVRLRRAALAGHSCEARWRQLLAGSALPVPPPRQVSVVLATRRPDMVGFAVDQVRRQRGVPVQLVLVLHGFSATSPQVVDALRELPFPHEVVERPAQEVFGAVLNAGVRRCDGDAVAKMDDDDWYGPHHLADLAAAQRWSGSEATGSAADYVYLEPLDLTVRRAFPSEIYAPYVAGGTLFVDRQALAAVGGFRSVPQNVDGNMLRDLHAAGGRVYRTHALGFVLRRTAHGHTWSADLTYFLRGRGPQWRGFRPSRELDADVRHVPARRARAAS